MLVRCLKALAHSPRWKSPGISDQRGSVPLRMCGGSDQEQSSRFAGDGWMVCRTRSRVKTGKLCTTWVRHPAFPCEHKVASDDSENVNEIKQYLADRSKKRRSRTVIGRGLYTITSQVLEGEQRLSSETLIAFLSEGDVHDSEEETGARVPQRLAGNNRAGMAQLPENRERLTWLRSVYNGYSRWDPLDEDESKVEQQDSSDKVESTKIFLDALQLKPNDVDILFKFAQYLTHSGKGAEASSYLEQILQIDPSHSMALDRATSSTRLLKRTHEWWKARGCLQECCQAEMMYKEAIACADKPDMKAMFCANYAQFCFARRKNIKEAKRLYMQAISLHPEESQFLTHLAILLSHNGENDGRRCDVLYEKVLTILWEQRRRNILACDVPIPLSSSLFKIITLDCFLQATGLQQNDLDSLNAFAVRWRGIVPERDILYLVWQVFLENVRGDLDRAEVNEARESTDCDDNKITIMPGMKRRGKEKRCCSSFNFLVRSAIEELSRVMTAEIMYKRALTLSPTNINALTNYGFFLSTVREGSTLSRVCCTCEVGTSDSTSANLVLKVFSSSSSSSSSSFPPPPPPPLEHAR
eukprot:764747-Hanusia_phi.AAC.1